MFDKLQILECLEIRKQIHYNDSINQKKLYDKCVNIMSQDEATAIEFIKEIYLKYSDYIVELMDFYFEQTESKNFVKEMWQFFNKEEEFENKKWFINELVGYIYCNDWEEESWFKND